MYGLLFAHIWLIFYGKLVGKHTTCWVFGINHFRGNDHLGLSMILPTYPGKIPQTSPNPHNSKEIPKHKLLVIHVRGPIFQGYYVGEILEFRNYKSRWWQLKDFWNFHPEPWGNDFQFDEHMFQMGWELNHQPGLGITHILKSFFGILPSLKLTANAAGNGWLGWKMMILSFWVSEGLYKLRCFCC